VSDLIPRPKNGLVSRKTEREMAEAREETIKNIYEAVLAGKEIEAEEMISERLTSIAIRHAVKNANDAVNAAHDNPVAARQVSDILMGAHESRMERVTRPLRKL